MKKHFINETKMMTNAKEFSYNQLERLTQWSEKAGKPLTGDLLDAAKKLIEESLFEDCVYPNITSAEADELIFYWKAGEASIEVDLDHQQGYYVRFKRADGTAEDSYGDFEELPYAQVKTELSEFTTRVNRLNPNWREIFDSHYIV